MHLEIGGHKLSIGQMALDFLILDEPAEHPPAAARIFLSIDGRESEWDVYLPEGISPQKKRVALALSADALTEADLSPESRLTAA